MPAYFRHSHPWWEIVFYTHGSGRLLFDGGEIAFKPGTAICIPPDVCHSEEADVPFMNRWVAVERLDMDEDFLIFQVPLKHPVLSLISILYEESRVEHSHSKMIVRQLFGAFMLYLDEWLIEEPLDVLVADLKRLIVNGLHDPEFRVNDAMDSIPLSRDYLRRLFKKKFGLSPKQYLIDLRMSRARELLALGMRVKNVADSTGYLDPYHFSKAFHQVHGQSPSSWRQKNT
ncbi:MAG: helix-turn-helix domain-containing protein [Candidatus Sumerlaeia bacterium]